MHHLADALKHNTVILGRLTCMSYTSVLCNTGTYYVKNSEQSNQWYRSAIYSGSIAREYSEIFYLIEHSNTPLYRTIQTLLMLDLDENSIGDLGAACLASALQHNKVRLFIYLFTSYTQGHVR